MVFNYVILAYQNSSFTPNTGWLVLWGWIRTGLVVTLSGGTQGCEALCYHLLLTWGSLVYACQQIDLWLHRHSSLSLCRLTLGTLQPLSPLSISWSVLTVPLNTRSIYRSAVPKEAVHSRVLASPQITAPFNTQHKLDTLLLSVASCRFCNLSLIVKVFISWWLCIQIDLHYETHNTQWAEERLVSATPCLNRTCPRHVISWWPTLASKT